MIHGRGPFDTQGPRHAHPAAGCRSAACHQGDTPATRWAMWWPGKLAGWLHDRRVGPHVVQGGPMIHGRGPFDTQGPRHAHPAAGCRSAACHQGDTPATRWATRWPGKLAGWLHDRRADPHVLQAGPMIHGRGADRDHQVLVVPLVAVVPSVTTRFLVHVAVVPIVTTRSSSTNFRTVEAVASSGLCSRSLAASLWLFSISLTIRSATRAACRLSGMRVSSRTDRSDHSCCPLGNAGSFSRYSEAVMSL